MSENAGPDEHVSWRAALYVMLFFSVLSLILRFIFSLEFFRIEFEVGLVYIPTAVLFGVWMLESRRRTRNPQLGSFP